ncbi:tRNA pseudouridine(55) synthase TruB [Paenibacillus albicereus]|uniref:tRNA pseudouridine synthase B n=1 Tax=Paenibacillus albicereus TaxID=2726185 RepID=A0A6H2GXT0_9BACL|nr:tRNA pseudouridine(55) synthase TruB [Paenibacillus albicereus]QJC52241.1 tRNA pseudouridine(55) synthase TruB [Paenibacillus albicereus]
MNGILPIWKPAGWTSHDVVAKCRRLLRTKRIGHAGTLDPMVTGVLPLCIGPATRFVEYLQEMPKEYEAVLQFGVATDTQDLTGETIERVDKVEIGEERLLETLLSFVGEIRQLPPMYSAVKVDGKRLYELAREGKTVERKPRQATIHELELLEADLRPDHPRIRFRVLCSKGTYIRTLCVDIGEKLGVPAAMAELTRTLSAGFRREDCVTLEELEALREEGAEASRLLAADRSLSGIPAFTAAVPAVRQALQGRRIPLDWLDGTAPASGMLRLYSQGGLFAGLFEAEPEDGMLKPVKVFARPEEV